jgi:hypothetical protein
MSQAPSRCRKKHQHKKTESNSSDIYVNYQPEQRYQRTGQQSGYCVAQRGMAIVLLHLKRDDTVTKYG